MTDDPTLSDTAIGTLPLPPVALTAVAPAVVADQNTVIARFGDKNSPLVAAVELQLRALNYPVGTPDGEYGTTTRAALLAYCANNDLPLRPNELDSFTLDKIVHAGVTNPLSPERVAATENSPALAGSRMILVGRVMKTVGSVLLGLLGVNSAADATPNSIADYLTSNYTNVLARFAAINQVANSIFASKFTVAMLLGLLIAAGAGFVYLRVEDHRTGANLGR